MLRSSNHLNHPSPAIHHRFEKRMVALTPIDPDRIQPWNPLSHLVDRKREPLCSLHVQEHLLLWPPRAALIKVSLALFIRNFLRRYGETGDIAAKPQKGARRSKIKGKDEELLPKLVKDKNDIHLRELQSSLLDRTGIEVSESIAILNDYTCYQALPGNAYPEALPP